MDLRPFQDRQAAATAPGIDCAALSLPRGNGKSWLAMGSLPSPSSLLGIHFSMLGPIRCASEA